MNFFFLENFSLFSYQINPLIFHSYIFNLENYILNYILVNITIYSF